MKQTFIVTGKEPHEPETDFQVTVLARNARQAKKYIQWLHAVYTKLTAYPTNEKPMYIADKF